MIFLLIIEWLHFMSNMYLLPDLFYILKKCVFTQKNALKPIINCIFAAIKCVFTQKFNVGIKVKA